MRPQRSTAVADRGCGSRGRQRPPGGRPRQATPWAWVAPTTSRIVRQVCRAGAVVAPLPRVARMTSIYTYIAYAAWALILIVWIPGYFSSRRAVRIDRPLLQMATTSLIALAFLLLFQRRSTGLLGSRLSEAPAAVALFADVVCVGATLFAIWARLTLGRNWSGAMASLGENHELVQSGPYRYVRHPIYTGFLLAMLATAVT